MALKQIGYYRIDRLLGSGGMGAVHEATHAMTGRRVAVKTLRAELADRPDLNARFFNEARTMSFLEHPGIVRVFDVGRTNDGTAYLVMELCVGPTLGERMRELLSLPARVGLLAPVADALAYAHSQGVIHRDLKPDNVIITDGPDGPCPKVLDFGIAKVLDGAIAAGSPFAVKTRTGTAMGTPLYMSPEQCRGMGGITPATDVYSLGIMLYEAISGHVPFDGGVGEVIVQHLTTPVPVFDDETVVDTRSQVKATVYAMLAKHAEARPDMAEVARALSAYIGSPHPDSIVPTASAARTAVSAPPTDPSPPPVAAETRVSESKPAPPRSSFPGKVIVVGLALGVAAVVAALAFPRPPRGPERAAIGPPRPTTAGDAPLAPMPAAAPWRIESAPPAADVFATDGTLLGRTPLGADALLARGIREVYVRKLGYREELVRYDAGGSSVVHLRPRVRLRPPTKDGARPAPQDDFYIQPVH